MVSKPGSIVVAFRATPAIVRVLHELAEAEDRSVSSVVRHLVVRALEEVPVGSTNTGLLPERVPNDAPLPIINITPA